jgi:hypothetical protein
MKVASSETSVTQITWRQIPQNSNFLSRCGESLKSCDFHLFASVAQDVEQHSTPVMTISLNFDANQK